MTPDVGQPAVAHNTWFDGGAFVSELHEILPRRQLPFAQRAPLLNGVCSLFSYMWSTRAVFARVHLVKRRYSR